MRRVRVNDKNGVSDYCIIIRLADAEVRTKIQMMDRVHVGVFLRILPLILAQISIYRLTGSFIAIRDGLQWFCVNHCTGLILFV